MPLFVAASLAVNPVLVRASGLALLEQSASRLTYFNPAGLTQLSRPEAVFVAI